MERGQEPVGGEDIKRVLSESVDWLYDRDTPGNQAAAEVQRVTLADTTARAASEAIEIGGMSTASLCLALLLLGEAKISAIEVR